MGGGGACELRHPHTASVAALQQAHGPNKVEEPLPVQ